MNGVTTAIVLFIFTALAFPHLIKNRSQFYMALAAALGIIVFDTSAHMFRSDSYIAFAYVICGILQIIAVILIVLSAGGLSARELAGEMTDAIEVMRRGETQKEVIIPLSASAYKKPNPDAPPQRRNPSAADEDLPRQTFNLNDPAAPRPAAPAPPKPDHGPLPLD